MRVLFTPYGGGSIAHIVRSLAIAEELKARGHDILFTAPTTKTAFIKKSGFEVFGKGHPNVNLNDELEQGIPYWKKHQSDFLDWLQDEVEAAEQFQPDIIVNSPTFFGPIASWKTGIPHITIINAIWLVEFQGILGLGKSTNSLRHRGIRNLARPILVRNFEKIYLSEIQEFYKKLGIPRIPTKRFDLHSHHPALIPGIPEFEPIDTPSRTNIHYIGPLFWNGFEQEAFDPHHYFNDIRKPLVYVTLGGSIYRKQSYLDLVQALLKKTEWNIVFSIGPNIDRSELPKDTAHLIIKPYFPGLKVSEYADVIINTGGHGTVMQALWHGKPVITLPHNIDQATIGARLEELGIGVNLNSLKLGDFAHVERYFERASLIPWEQIIAKTDQVLHTSSMQKKAEAFSRKLRAYADAPQKGADLIEKYAV